MTRRRRRLALIATAVVLAGILPPLLFLVLSYRQAVKEAEQKLQSYAQILQRRADEVFGNAEASLSSLAGRIDRNCTQASFEVLRKAVYDSLYFREAGLIYDEAVQCTSVRIFDPPVPITNPDHLVMPLHGIHISAPDLTLEGEVSIIVIYGVARGIAINLLLNPVLLTEPLNDVAASGDIAVSLTRKDGRALVRTKLAGSSDLLSAESDSARYPVRAVVTGSREWMLRDWRRNATLFLALGLAVSLPLFLVLKRLERREQSMDVQLRDAFDAGELRVHYQPIHSADGLRVVGAEALLRWEHPDRGLILPSVFVPVAEETGFIIPITHWLMRTVCTEMTDVLTAHPDFYVAINLSPNHFADPELPNLIRGIFGAPFTSGRLVFEITERELMDNSDSTARRVIDELREDGARVALDDFGTGYSSLRYLAQFRFDLLKIDKAFIDAIGTECVTAGLVNDMMAMARRLNLKTVAEGVETRQQLSYLQDLGVEFVQGWYFSKALPVAQLKAYLLDPRKPY